MNLKNKKRTRHTMGRTSEVTIKAIPSEDSSHKDGNGKNKIIWWLLGIVTILVAAVWGITWVLTRADVKENSSKISENTHSIQNIQRDLSEQTKILTSQLAQNKMEVKDEMRNELNKINTGLSDIKIMMATMSTQLKTHMEDNPKRKP